MELHRYLSDRRQLVEDALDRFIPRADEPPERLHDAIRYSVLAPGKRIRAILVIAGSEAVAGEGWRALPTACALECIHAFSLIHDDLPSMDDDDFRRGRPTNHKVFGEAMALLAGDALLALAFELIADNAQIVPEDRVVPVMKLISRAAGTAGMVGGQVTDIESEGKEITPEELQAIHMRKTGELIRASVMAGAMLSGCSTSELNALDSYGRSVGLAFQIADDILDVVGDEALIGKPVGSDQRQDKITYPRLFGLEESRRRAQHEVEHAIASLSAMGEAADPLRGIASYIVERDL
jgi:geranylgeranyl diphosphate synthase type II